MTRAWIRDLYGEEHDAKFSTLDAASGALGVAIVVPGFGQLVLVQRTNEEWGCAYTTGNAEDDARLGLPASREVRVLDDHVEVELLPNRAGEDRIVICFDARARSAVLTVDGDGNPIGFEERG